MLLHFPVSYWLCALYSLLCVVICPLMAYLGKGPVKRYVERKPGFWADVLQFICKTPVVCALALFFIWMALGSLDLSEEWRLRIRNAYQIFVLLNIAWLIDAVISLMIDKAFKISQARIEGNTMDINMVKTIDKIVSVIIWCITAIIALSILGIDIKALVATLGIGGVAIALAGQDTAKNLIGGVTILGDRTFRIGDRIIASGYEGYVEDIGLRSTKIRTLTGRIVTIPNGKLTDACVENVTMEPSRKVTMRLGITYGTTPEKMKEAINILKTLPKDTPQITKEIIASFTDFGEFSLGITFAYYIKNPRKADIWGVNHIVDMKVFERFTAAGISFAFPTQTIIMDKE